MISKTIIRLLLIVFLVNMVWGLVPKLFAAQTTVRPRYCSSNDHVQVLAEVTSIKQVAGNTGVVVVRMHILLRIVNTSKEPVIVLTTKEPLEYPLIGSVNIAQSKTDAQFCRYVYSDSEWPSLDRSPSWQKLHKELSQTNPPLSITRSIAPGDSWLFEKEIVFAFDKVSRNSNGDVLWDEIRGISPVWLQVELLMWPNNLEENMLKPRFGRGLRNKWKGKGHFILDNLVSEPVLISLPEK